MKDFTKWHPRGEILPPNRVSHSKREYNRSLYSEDVRCINCPMAFECDGEREEDKMCEEVE